VILATPQASSYCNSVAQWTRNIVPKQGFQTLSTVANSISNNFYRGVIERTSQFFPFILSCEESKVCVQAADVTGIIISGILLGLSAKRLHEKRQNKDNQYLCIEEPEPYCIAATTMTIGAFLDCYAVTPAIFACTACCTGTACLLGTLEEIGNDEQDRDVLPVVVKKQPTKKNR